MNNLNLSENSNNLYDSSKTQEKLYSNEQSLDDILTYSDDISQNQSYNKSLSKQNISLKEEKQGEAKAQIPIICSFNSEITMSFLNNEKEKGNNIIKNKEYKYSKSASKPFIGKNGINIEYKKNMNKSYNNKDIKKLNFTGFIDPFEDNIGNNLKDVSGFHASISNIFSEFEIKDISISKSNNDLKKINSEKENQKINNIEISNKNQISEEHSNTNSMCNYQNNSNVNDISSNNNKNENKKTHEEKKEKENELLSSSEIGEIKIKMNISLDDCNNTKNKFNSDKKICLDNIIDEDEINNKKIFSTSNKKESNSFYAHNTKQAKNSLKYTKAQCVQALFQNNNNTNIEHKQYILSDAPIKTKDTTSDKKKTKKIIILSPHKLSFEIQKNDCIQISYNKNKNSTIDNDLNNNISLINNNSELSISKVEDVNLDKNNYFYNNDLLKQNNTTSFTISPNTGKTNQFIHRKISYQKNKSIRNKKIFINNRNINIHKDESNNFFFNPNHPLASGPIISNLSCNKKIQNELHTPDLNKNKITPMTCVHKGSLVYYNETNNGEGNNTIKYNYSNNGSHFVKKNKSGINNSIDKKPKLNNQKKLVYLKSNVNKNNRMNNKENIEINSKLKQVTIINNKNKSYIKINNNENKNINKIQGIRKSSKITTKQLIKKKKITDLNNNNNSKINNTSKKNLALKNISNNNNSINSNNNSRRLLRCSNKIKLKTKTNSIINKINNQIIKESSLFHILYNMPARNANTTKNNSGTTSKDEKESTIIQKNSSKEKEKENPKKIVQKKLIKHNTNNSFSLYNSYFDKMMEDSKRKNNSKILSKDKNKNKSVIRKNIINSNGNRSHRKINSEINIDSLTSNFNFNNINIMKRRKNNKSLYNFGNIFFINQNHIIKDEPQPNNSNVIKCINKNIKIETKNKINNKCIYKDKIIINKSKSKNKNKLIVSTKQNPKIINDFSKYRKKKEIVVKDKLGTNNKIYNKQEYKETQLISEN